tara:strand:+ start:484 stop:1221 length:738 start_codon:yes stop_codon:yes gene_type:complete
MKHLLILISFILLSSPVFGQETGVLYQYETSTGIKWKTFGNEKLQPKYEGEIKNGEVDGFGFMTYPYGEKSVVGEWKNGKEWNTKHTKKDGTLIGKFENGEWILIWGILFKKKHKLKRGEGWFSTNSGGYYNNGDESQWVKYEGDIKNLKPNGFGIQNTNLGDVYEGEWKDGKFDGQGTYTSEHRKYVISWKNGKPHGKGILIWSDGKKWKGDWNNGKPWNVEIFDKNGYIYKYKKFVNGKTIYQ